jgi:hypothetical protein
MREPAHGGELLVDRVCRQTAIEKDRSGAVFMSSNASPLPSKRLMDTEQKNERRGQAALRTCEQS